MALTTSTFGTGEFGRGKTLLALMVVIGCFAVLWPKIFYPMLTSSLFPGSNSGDGGDLCCDVIFEKDTNAYKLMNEICASIIQKEGLKPPKKVTSTPPPEPVMITYPPKNKFYKEYVGPAVPPGGSPDAVMSTANLCRNEILETCKIDILVLLNENPTMSKEYKESLVQLRSFNVSQCLKDNYGVDLEGIGLPKRFKAPGSSPRHMRPERPIHMPQMVHPALREKGSAIPHPQRRPLEMEPRPGPQPGIRPPMGGGLNAPAQPRGGGGTMGVIMPLYTIAIVCFFLYTIFKILFRKSDDNVVIAKDRTSSNFGLEAEQRKYVSSYADDYDTASANRSIRDPYYCNDRGDLGVRRRSSVGIAPIPTVAMVQDISVPKQIAPIALSASEQIVSKANGTGPQERDARDAEIDILRKRLEETEAAMERIVKQMGSVSEHLSPTLLAQVLQAQAISQKEEPAPEPISVEPPAEEPELLKVTEEPLTVTPTDQRKMTLELKEPDHMRRKGGQPRRPPTPIRLVSSESEETEEEEEEEAEQEKPASKSDMPPLLESYELVKFAQELSSLIIKEALATAAVSLAYANRKENAAAVSAPEVKGNVAAVSAPEVKGNAAAVSAPEAKENATAVSAPEVKSQPIKSPGAESVAVVGMDESVGLENGEKWTDRSPTPTFPRLSSSPLPPAAAYHRPPTPPVEVKNIYLEGPIPSPANQILISNSECEEVDMDEDYDYEDDEDYDSENDKPVVLSGKVTLSVLSGIGEDRTEAPSFSAEEGDKVTGQIENAIKEIDNGKTEVLNGSVPNVVAQQQSKGSSPDMDEYEVVGKADTVNELQTEEADAEADATHYTTADAEVEQINATGEETSADISVMEGLNEEEYDEEEEEEDEEEEEVDEEEEEEEEEEDEEEEEPEKVPPAKGH